MIKESADQRKTTFIEDLQSANNSITVAQASDIFNVLDAVQVLLAIPKGQRITVNKKRLEDRN
jgi:hypothetical protein